MMEEGWITNNTTVVKLKTIFYFHLYVNKIKPNTTTYMYKRFTTLRFESLFTICVLSFLSRLNYQNLYRHVIAIAIFSYI